MNKKYMGIAQVIIKTDDIKNLEQKYCEQLKCGDIVVYVDSDGKEYSYQVIFKSENKLSFCYTDNEKAEIVKFEKGESGWVWKSTNDTELGGGGTQLYKHTVNVPTNNGGDEGEQQLILITTDGTALTGRNSQLQIPGVFISGTCQNTLESEAPINPLIGYNFYNGWWVCCEYDNIVSLENEGNYKTDTVVAL